MSYCNFPKLVTEDPKDRFRRATFRVLWTLLTFAVTVGVVRVSPAVAQQWEKVVAEAKREGKVVVAGPSGAVYRPALIQAFQKEFPEIQVEYNSFRPGRFKTRIIAERRAKKKLWDVHINGMPGPVSLKRAGVLVDLRPVVRPDIKRDRNWQGGFNFGFVDDKKMYNYGFFGELQTVVYANRTFMPSSKFNNPRQLIDPEFKGKIVVGDPRRFGAGLARMAAIMSAFGEDFVRKLFTTQQMVYTSNRRQVVEWLINGRYPIAIGVAESALYEYVKQGVGKDVKPVISFEVSVWSTATGNISLIDSAPHPNAAKLYINWILSKRAQELLAKDSNHNSRRTDIDPVRPENFPDPKRLKQYTRNDENWRATQIKVRNLAKKLIK